MYGVIFAFGIQAMNSDNTELLVRKFKESSQLKTLDNLLKKRLPTTTTALPGRDPSKWLNGVSGENIEPEIHTLPCSNAVQRTSTVREADFV
jgi:hypothetical protein